MARTTAVSLPRPTALHGAGSQLAGRALTTARRWSAARGVDLATGMANRERLLADLAQPHVAPRRLELVSIRRGDGLDALLSSGSAAIAGVVALMGSAARAHGAAAYRLDEAVYAFLGPLGTGSGTPAATARTAAAALADDVASEMVHGEVLLPEEAQAPDHALGLAVERLRARARLQRRSAERQVRDVLLQALGERRAGGADVAMPQVAAHAVAVGRRVGLDLAELDVLVRAAELQDIGRLAIPDSILNKRGPLTEAEWEIVRRHPAVGERILRAAPALAPVARIVRSCSERFDGSGYPDGLRGDEIPLGARIIAVCVAFDAMTSPRPYRPAGTSGQAFEELCRCVGAQFDPMVVAAFSAAMGDRYSGASSPATTIP
jgi:two-component system cell cycle response regulator